VTRLTVAAALLLVPGWAHAQTTAAPAPSPSKARPSPSPSASPSPGVRPPASPAARPSPAPTPGPPEFLWLLDGDRVTGTITSETARVVRLKTPYGALVIPKNRIARLVRANGKEEVLHAVAVAAAPSPAPSPVAPRARLVLAVTGNTFFMAWDRKDAPADPTLRLELRLDEDPLAMWMDSRLDPEEVPGAVVNAFSFAPADVAAAAAPEVQISPAEVQPGRVVLRLELPPAAETRTLRIAYQVNQGTAQSPAWRDVASTSAPVPLRADATTLVQVRQDRGRMEFAGFPRRKMRNVETFRLDLAVE
jgi:hypothetical protein